MFTVCIAAFALRPPGTRFPLATRGEPEYDFGLSESVSVFTVSWLEPGHEVVHA